VVQTFGLGSYHMLWILVNLCIIMDFPIWVKVTRCRLKVIADFFLLKHCMPYNDMLSFCILIQYIEEVHD
jgi:hypothetical protein